MTEQTAYTTEHDPADFTVDQVTLAMAKDPEVVEFVKELEAEGKARKGILDWAPTVADVEPDEDGYTRVPVPEDQAYVPGEPAPVEADTQE